MKINTILTTCLIATTMDLRAQTFEWAKSFGGPADESGYDICADPNGNVYVTGQFKNFIDFDPGPETDYHVSPGPYSDAFVLKMDAAGNYIWAKSFIGPSTNSRSTARCISIDASGNLYTAGFFKGTIDFDPGPGTDFHTPINDEGIFVQKMDNNGNFIWAKSFSGVSSTISFEMVLDATGYIYTTGEFQGASDFDPGPETYNLTASSGTDVFVQKMDSDGNFLWAIKRGGFGNDGGRSISVDNEGNVYNLGWITAIVDFDPGPGTTFLGSAGNTTRYLMKLDAAGNFLWAKPLVEPIGDATLSIVSMKMDSLGNVYTYGSFRKTIDFDPGPESYLLSSLAGEGPNGRDAFVQKLDALGNFVWAKSFGGIDIEFVVEFTLDAAGNVYSIGTFYSPVPADFDPGPGTYYITSEHQLIYLHKLDTDGNFVWAHSFGAAAPKECSSISVDALGNIYTTGFFRGTVDFDPGPDSTNITALGGNEIFVQKFSQCLPTDGVDTLTACGSYTWIDGNTYTTSNNTATHLLSNAGGCDSIVMLNLTITNPTNVTDNQSACNSYTWIDGNTYTSSNNIATYILESTLGCDSIVTLNLTITNPTNATDTQTACNSYTWIDGNTYTSSNSTATYIIDNAAGCDSIVTLNLTITSVSNIGTTLNGTTITANNNNATYQWMDCDNNNSPIAGATSQTYTATQTGNYAVSITENGCTNTSACVAVTIIGIDESNNALQANVYPNPSQGQVEITLGKTITDVELVLTDVQGKVVFKRNYPSLFKTNIELPDAKGVYFLKINAQDNTTTLRVVKE